MTEYLFILTRVMEYENAEVVGAYDTREEIENMFPVEWEWKPLQIRVITAGRVKFRDVKDPSYWSASRRGSMYYYEITRIEKGQPYVYTPEEG